MAAASFTSEAAATVAARALRAAGLRAQDVTVLASDPRVAAAVAAEADVFTPRRRPLFVLRVGQRLPRDVRRRYGGALAAGSIVVVAAALTQPAETLEAVLERAGGAAVVSWWQEPTDIFPPAELAGPL